MVHTVDIVIMYKLGKWILCTTAVRPLLAGISLINVKTRVVDSLRQLKLANQRFRSVSISNDRTLKQREQIKKLLLKQ